MITKLVIYKFNGQDILVLENEEILLRACSILEIPVDLVHTSWIPITLRAYRAYHNACTWTIAVNGVEHKNLFISDLYKVLK